MKKTEQRPWGRFFRRWLAPTRGKPTAMAVLVILSAHANDVSGECWPSIETIAKELEVHPNRVGDALRVLVDVGIITRTRPNRRGPYCYRVLLDPPQSGESPESGVGDPPESGVGDPPDSRRQKRSRKEHENITTSTTPVDSVKHGPSAELIAVLSAIGITRDDALLEATIALKTVSKAVGDSAERLLVDWVSYATKAPRVRHKLPFAIAMAKSGDPPPSSPVKADELESPSAAMRTLIEEIRADEERQRSKLPTEDLDSQPRRVVT